MHSVNSIVYYILKKAWDESDDDIGVNNQLINNIR